MPNDTALVVSGVATSNPATNQSLIDGITVAPEEVLTYAPRRKPV